MTQPKRPFARKPKIQRIHKAATIVGVGSFIQQINAESNPVRHIDLDQRIQAKRSEIQQYKRATYEAYTYCGGGLGQSVLCPREMGTEYQT
jgi:hypothetical protein